MYYIEEKEYSDEVVITKYRKYNHIDDIPIELLSEVKQGYCPTNTIEVLPGACEKRIKNIITENKKYLTKEEIDDALKGLFDKLKNHQYKHPWFYPYYGININYKQLAKDMGLHIITENIIRGGGFHNDIIFPIYIDQKDALKEVDVKRKKLQELNDVHRIRVELNFLQSYLNEIIKKMYINYYGDIFNKSNIFKAEHMFDAYISSKKLFKLSYKQISSLVDIIPKEIYIKESNVKEHIKKMLYNLDKNKPKLKDNDLRLIKEFKKIVRY